jgi:tRNA threonylcarbamoyladenosine biosynthesis protein TsaB
MLILAVDTSTKSGSTAVLRDAHVLAHIANSSEERYSTRLIPDVVLLLEQARISLREMDLFAVVSGPGSFTGLRVGLTAVKAWAEIMGKPVAAVSSLEAIAAQLPAAEFDMGSSVLAPILDARRGQVFGGLYARRSGPDSLEPLSEEVVSGPEEFLDLVAGHTTGRLPRFASPTPEVIIPWLARSIFHGARVEKVSGILAPVVGRLGLARARRSELVDALHLDANYLRRSDAELHWKGE